MRTFQRLEKLVAASQLVGRGNDIVALFGESCPSGSIKDISVVGMLTHLANRGRLSGRRTVYGSTSGNTGLAAAERCAERNLHFHAIVDARIEAEKLAGLRERGASVTQVDGDVFTRIRLSDEMARQDPCGVDLDQYGNEGALLGHYQVTGPAIWRDMRGRIDALFVALGTGGTFGGTAAFLTGQDPRIQCIPVDAHGSVLITGRPAKRLLTGIGCAFVPKNVYRAYAHVRGVPYVATDAESFAAARWLLAQDGIGVGGSGGSVLSAAMVYAQQVRNKRIVLIFHDGARAYQSTVFNDDWYRANGFCGSTERSNNE